MQQMKDSGIEWIGQIPNDWRAIPNRYLFINHSKKVGEDSCKYQLLSLTTNGVKEKDINTPGGKVPTSYDNYQTVIKGDMIFCLFDLDCSAVFSGLSNYDGMITSAYDVFKPNDEYIDKNYIKYWFQYVFSNRYYKMYSKNIRYTITKDIFASIHTPLPALKNQIIIGKLLDKKCEKIDSLIDIESQMIEKLKEYKQSVITEVVTRGLDKSIPLKDSGVDCIGQIPKYWQVCKIKNLFKLYNGGTPSSSNSNYFNGDIVWITPADMEDLGYIYNSNRNITMEGYNSCNTFLVSTNSIIVSSRAPIGKIGIAKVDLCTNQGCKSLVAKDIEIDNKYYYYFLYISNEKLQLLGNGTTFMELSTKSLNEFEVLFPDMAEQKQIVDYLDKMCEKIDSLIEIKQQKIDKLIEYKKTLIYEYVTGKKKVG